MWELSGGHVGHVTCPAPGRDGNEKCSLYKIEMYQYWVRIPYSSHREWNNTLQCLRVTDISQCINDIYWYEKHLKHYLPNSKPTFRLYKHASASLSLHLPILTYFVIICSYLSLISYWSLSLNVFRCICITMNLTLILSSPSMSVPSLFSNYEFEDVASVSNYFPCTVHISLCI